MNLIRGIPIISDINPNDISINSGSCLHSYMNFQNLDFPFREGAYIPKNDWRKLTRSELDTVGSKNYNFLDYFYIGRLPSNLIKTINNLHINGLKDRDLVFEKIRRDETKLEILNKEINEFITGLSPCGADFEFHRLSVIPSGRYVTSINLNQDDFEYLGLHIDHSTYFDIEGAHKSRNRICINIGSEDRFLYVINLSLIQIKEMLGKIMDPSTINIENISENFFYNFPDYPILKIKQKPFEFYIAPTDNCIHDGSTFDNTELDITITYLGKFVQK